MVVRMVVVVVVGGEVHTPSARSTNTRTLPVSGVVGVVVVAEVM